MYKLVPHLRLRSFDVSSATTAWLAASWRRKRVTSAGLVAGGEGIMRLLRWKGVEGPTECRQNSPAFISLGMSDRAGNSSNWALFFQSRLIQRLKNRTELRSLHDGIEKGMKGGWRFLSGGKKRVACILSSTGRTPYISHHTKSVWYGVNGYSYFQLHRHPVCHLIHNICAEKSVILAGGRISTTYVSQEFGTSADDRCRYGDFGLTAVA